ncbi:MAG TPA: hypothetical protein VJ437_02000 [Acidiferrobacterales bacterium]|uniref:Uncharacterized protein n=1 Tax=Candidatus Muproteobacteria bacterium RBG_16_62_13 TaxID=1817756 RepID=A0A1F6SYN4_9PROT|nr:MAG: hypothetical protein A2140_01565 [Candidatus Muproteobacteria bacterium RBG_16_62_13]HJX16948.1 hypothetical protein [Acidiferrobacterales bacterium]
MAFGFTLLAGDLVNTGNPEADRPATLLNIATRAYPDFGTLTAPSQTRVVNTLATQRPASDTDAAVQGGGRL